MLMRDDGGKLIDVRLDQRLETEHHARALHRWSRRPRRQCFTRDAIAA